MWRGEGNMNVDDWIADSGIDVKQLVCRAEVCGVLGRVSRASLHARTIDTPGCAATRSSGCDFDPPHPIRPRR